MYKPTQVIGLTQKGMVKRIVILLSLLRTKAVVPIVKASKSNPAERKTLKLATNGNQERKVGASSVSNSSAAYSISVFVVKLNLSIVA